VKPAEEQYTEHDGRWCLAQRFEDGAVMFTHGWLEEPPRPLQGRLPLDATDIPGCVRDAFPGW